MTLVNERIKTMFDALFSMWNTVATNGNLTSFFIYGILVAVCCAIEQYRYFNEVMAQPLLPGSTVD